MKTYQLMAALQVSFPFKQEGFIPASQGCVCAKHIIKAPEASRSAQVNRRSYREHSCSGEGQRQSPRLSLSA